MFIKKETKVTQIKIIRHLTMRQRSVLLYGDTAASAARQTVEKPHY